MFRVGFGLFQVCPGVFRVCLGCPPHVSQLAALAAAGVTNKFKCPPLFKLEDDARSSPSSQARGLEVRHVREEVLRAGRRRIDHAAVPHLGGLLRTAKPLAAISSSADEEVALRPRAVRVQERVADCVDERAVAARREARVPREQPVQRRPALRRRVRRRYLRALQLRFPRLVGDAAAERP